MLRNRFRLKPRARSLIVLFHRWAGICIGIHIGLLCLTGSILIYGEDIDTLLNPSLRTTQGTGTPISPVEAIRRYRQAKPGVAVERIYPPQGALGTYRLRTGPKKAQLESFVDPYTGTFLGERVQNDTLLRKLSSFHISLLGAPFGRSINGFSAMLGVWIFLTGLRLWWPSTREQLRARLTFKRNASRRRRTMDAHNVVGTYALAIVVASMTTGFMWAFEDVTDGMFGLIGGKPRSKPPSAVAPTGKKLLTDTQLLDISRSLAPDSHVVKYIAPTGKTRIAEVHREWSDGDKFGNKLLAYIDAETGAVVDRDDSRTDNFGTSLSRFVRPFHRGLWGGNFSRALYAVAGFAPIFLVVTGFMKLRQRRQASRDLALRRSLEEPQEEETAEEKKELVMR